LFVVAGCRATGPFDVDLRLVPSALPAGTSCLGIERSLSGFDCVEAGTCLLARPVTALESRLEVVSLPDEALGARVPELVTGFCTTPGACPVELAGGVHRFECDGLSVGECLARELGALDDVVALTEPVEIDVRGTALFRVVVSDASPGCSRADPTCVVGCAYTLPLVLGRGPVEATMAIDAPGGCNAAALRVCASYAGLP
jgi:hypothetical protein